MKYNFSAIEKKWAAKWLKEKIYEPDFGKSGNKKRKFYNLMMFPYPSAEGLHVGNAYAFIGSDIYGRFKRMQGYDVFEPMGLDGFGIHSENYALKIGTHPLKQSEASEKRFYGQLKNIGNGFAWDERLETYKPEYYKWTQWIFTEMWRNGLAYRKKQEVNWCPSCKTVLSDEQAEGGKCERCASEVVKKELEQWFFRITKYAGKLLKNLDEIDWSEKVKIAQRNWIGKSEGALIKFKVPISNIKNKEESEIYLEVFTTRPDTLFGATYMVVAPEHEIIGRLRDKIQNNKEVENYIFKSKKKTTEERIENKEKTGVELKSIKAINPANNEEIPIFVADYVLMGYGTGAIMAVPAHDERDFEFAKQFQLPVRQVVAEETGMKREKEERRDGVFVIVFDPNRQKYAAGRQENGILRLFSGGADTGENMKNSALRELSEESGLYDFQKMDEIGTVFAHYHNSLRNVNRITKAVSFLVVLKSGKTKPVKLEKHEKFTLEWTTAEDMEKNWEEHNKEGDFDHWIKFLRQSVGQCIEFGFDKKNDPERYKTSAYEGDGILVNSENFTGMDSEKARWKITEFVGGKKQTQYRLRDWLISRQRYWGPPIPMIFCEKCSVSGNGEQKNMPGWYTVPESELPVKLPNILNFRPRGTGESPLASEKKFYETKCPACGNAARRETDASDTFLDSAWYYIGYLMKISNFKFQIKDSRFSEIARQWLPVDAYIGGAEHSVLHLLYVRFVAMALKDFGHISFEEPFPKFRAHGLLVKDGAKMSKSKGNVVNPDEYINKFGADTFRMYLMFLAPFECGGDFRDGGILGISRFLERVWKIGTQGEFSDSPALGDTEHLLHKTVKKVGEDVESLQYNTAISALMIFLNKFEKTKNRSLEHFRTFLLLLAPFAPFVAEELWQMTLGENKSAGFPGFNSIHKAEWPSYDAKKLEADYFVLAIQVNGKVRDEMEVPKNMPQGEIEKHALQRERILKFMEEKKPKRIIFVPGKILNIVL